MRDKALYIAVCAVMCAGAAAFARITGNERARIVAIIAAVYGALIFISGIWERYHTKRFARFKEKYADDNRYLDGDEIQNGAKPKKKHGRTMKSDLLYRYRTHHAPAALLCALLFLIVAVVTPDVPLHGRIVAVLISSGAMWYGLYRFIAVPVIRFYKKLADSELKQELVSEDYMDGSLFVKGKEGINIGRRYIVIFNGANVYITETADTVAVIIEAIDRKQILEEIYLYSVIDYKITLMLKNACALSVTLDKKQADAALSELKILGIKTVGREEIKRVEYAESMKK